MIETIECIIFMRPCPVCSKQAMEVTMNRDGEVVNFICLYCGNDKKLA